MGRKPSPHRSAVTEFTPVAPDGPRTRSPPPRPGSRGSTYAPTGRGLSRQGTLRQYGNVDGYGRIVEASAKEVMPFLAGPGAAKVDEATAEAVSPYPLNSRAVPSIARILSGEGCEEDCCDVFECVEKYYAKDLPR